MDSNPDPIETIQRGLEQLVIDLPDVRIEDLTNSVISTMIEIAKRGYVHDARKIFLGSEDSLSLYPLRHEVYVRNGTNHRKVDLTLTEYNILKVLMENSGRAVTRHKLARSLIILDQGMELMGPEPRFVSWHIYHIREKIGDTHRNPMYIETIRGVGYKFIGQNT